MKRRKLIINEALVKKVQTRQGWVYHRREAQGPPPPKDPALDELVYLATQSFDFSPLFSGDANQARQMAVDLRAHIQFFGEQAGMDKQTLKGRLRELVPYWRRAIRTFQTSMEGAIKS